MTLRAWLKERIFYEGFFMAIRYLKNGKTETARAEDDAQVRKNVEEILTRLGTRFKRYYKQSDKP